MEKKGMYVCMFQNVPYCERILLFRGIEENTFVSERTVNEYVKRMKILLLTILLRILLN